MEEKVDDHMGSMLVCIKGENRKNQYRVGEWRMPHIFYIYKIHTY